MSGYSRRTVICHATAMGALATIGGLAWAETPPKPMVRVDATSPQGKAMLRIYADAVSLMMAMDAKEPLSWTFQWYIHAIPSNATKASELARIFPTASAAATLADVAWSTCEPHFSGTEPNFLPWHRMYVAAFEAIIRAVSKRPDFTLPYWNYTAPGAARALPPEFLKKDDPVWGSLYRPNRRNVANNGQPIDSGAGSLPVNLDAMRATLYTDDGSDAGFCANLDGNLHGNIHVNVGNGQGMGSVPWAANDPIFWLHHCNIDRVWASWNRAGGKNPSDADFLNQTFIFASAAGIAAQMSVGNVLQLAQAGYTYDAYLPRPPGSKPFPKPGAGGFKAVPHAVTSGVSGPITLGTERSTVALEVVKPAGSSAGFSALMQTLPPGRSAYLRLVGLRTNKDVTGGYDVYVGLRAGEQPSRNAAAYVGTLNFFGTFMHHDHAAMAGMVAPPGRTISFDISAATRKAITSSGAEVTFIPFGEIAPDDKPTIARIEIVSK